MTIRLSQQLLSSQRTALPVRVLAPPIIEGTDRMKARAYSPAVITDGGSIVWLAGMGGITDADGKPDHGFCWPDPASVTEY